MKRYILTFPDKTSEEVFATRIKVNESNTVFYGFVDDTPGKLIADEPICVVPNNVTIFCSKEIQKESLMEKVNKAMDDPKTLDEIMVQFEATFHLSLDVDRTHYKSKLYAIKCMIAVADYLNGDWKPDWNVWQPKDHNRLIYWSILINDFGKIFVRPIDIRTTAVYFRTEQMAQQAIDILSEEKIKLALS